MVRISKQGRRRAVSYKKPRIAGEKTGAKKDNLEKGYKVHANALDTNAVVNTFIPKI